MFKRLIPLICAMMLLAACDTGNATPDNPGEEIENPEDKPGKPDGGKDDKDDPGSTPGGDYYSDLVSKGWTDLTDDYILSSYIKVFKAPEELQGQSAVAYIAVADMAKGAKFEVLGALEYCNDEAVANYGGKSLNTPDQFYKSSKAQILINAGLFYYAAKSDKSKFYVSQNMAVRNGKLLAINQNYWVEDWNTNPIVMWFPTVGTFYQTEDGTCHTGWTWTRTDNKGRAQSTWFYTKPADNAIDKTPLQTPDANFPEKGVLFEDMKITNAIGGVGVLINKGEIVNTWKQECFGVLADSRHPRTAIGYTEDQKLIFFVCEGRQQTPGVPGYTTGEEAEIMKSLGCVEALNLDGGGSSCMLINGKETIKPSDGAQRPVLTGLKMF